MATSVATVIGLGAIAGMRTCSGPVFTCASLSRAKDLDSLVLDFLGSTSVRRAVTIAAAGEMIADKLPGIPSRTAKALIAGRIISGAACGAAIARIDRRSAVGGAVLGAIAAFGAAHLTFRIRRQLARCVPDPIVGLAEDVLVIATGRAIVNSRV